MRVRACVVLGLPLLCAHAFAAGAGIGCDGDIDNDLSVDSTDLNLLLADFGATGPGLAGDIDGDEDVDSADLNALLGEFGSCAFDYGPTFENAEARQIGYEMLGASGPMLLPVDIYDRVVIDLDAIRGVVPELEGQGHTPAWSPTGLIVSVPDALGSAPIDAYNAYFGVVNASDSISFGGNTYWVLTFPAPLNIPALALAYAALDGVNFAEPDGLIGGQNFYSPEQFPGNTWLWFIDDGFHDCFDGCDCHYYYEFETDGEGGATLIDQSQFGAPWCPWPI